MQKLEKIAVNIPFDRQVRICCNGTGKELDMERRATAGGACFREYLGVENGGK